MSERLEVKTFRRLKMPRGIRPIYVEVELHEEMTEVAKKMGFKKLTDFLRVWWKNPAWFGEKIENTKKEIERSTSKEK